MTEEIQLRVRAYELALQEHASDTISGGSDSTPEESVQATAERIYAWLNSGAVSG